MRTNYQLECLACKTKILDDDLPLYHEGNHPLALLRPIYSNKELTVKDDSNGIYKFSNWLPIQRNLKGSSAPVTYKSEKLNDKLNLPNLYITFNGYWPEKNIRMTTGTFKECEAYSVCARMPKDFNKILVVASAGNTARAFAKVCSENNIDLALVVPQPYLGNLSFKEKINPCVRLIAAGGDSDYSDAIALAEIIYTIEGFTLEGGARNVARRAGMGTTVLSAINAIGEIPDYYFQAVGSGTGAIAAWESNLLFIKDGRYGDKKMKLLVSQNEPFLLIYDSWKNKTRNLIQLDEDIAKAQIEKINAKVLSNRTPPYDIIGGLFDALVDTNGDVLKATNNEADLAAKIFEETEGIDITPAASISFASLLKKKETPDFNKNAVIMLNITGGGRKRFMKENKMMNLQPSVIIDKKDFDKKRVEEILKNLF